MSCLDLRALALFACLASPIRLAAASENWEISTLSTRPDMVSGGDVLIEVGAPDRTTSLGVRASLNGRDVTGMFRVGQTAGSLIGRVDGLQPGSNTFEITVDGKTQVGLNSSTTPTPAPSSPDPTRLLLFARPRTQV